MYAWEGTGVGEVRLSKERIYNYSVMQTYVVMGINPFKAREET